VRTPLRAPAATLLAEHGIRWPLAMEHSQHRVLRFDVGMRCEIARALLQALQRGPEILPHHCRTCLSNRNRYVTVVHTEAPQTLPIGAMGACINASLRPDVQAAI
jgi:hypothetical protein